MSEIFPTDGDDYILQQLGIAQNAGDYLRVAGSEARVKLNWSEQQYGESIARLAESQMIKANLQQTGSGRYAIALPREVTGIGWYRIKLLRDQSET